jgi:hypothetical protein
MPSGGKGKDKGKSKGKGKNNCSGNNNMGTPVWPPQQPARPPQHALLAKPTYYGTPDGPSFVPLAVPPPH